MATYGDLKQRIVSEMTRDDLEDDLSSLLETHIARAIDYYQGERFWFNYGSASATTTTDNPVLAMPATMRVVDKIRDANGLLLTKLPLDEMLSYTSSGGTPTHYAEYGDGFYLYPTPSSAATLTLYGTKYVAAPTADTDTNIWTVQAYDLISAHTQATLYREKFRDPDGVARAQGATTDAFKRLKRETARRNESPLRASPMFPASRYSVFTG